MALPRTLRLASMACGLGLAAAAVVHPPASAAERTATVTVLHAIPAGMGADVVDVYAGRTLLIDDLRPGKARVIEVPGGSYDLTVYADDIKPGTASPLLSAPGTRVRSGSNMTVTANLTAAGTPALTAFTNNTSTVGRGMGRLTVRHIAAAPPVDVRGNGRLLFTKLRNPRQDSVGLDAGTYRLAISLAGSRKAVITPDSVRITNSPGSQDMGTNTIVYIWGSAADGSLRQTVQNVRLDLR